MDATRCPGCGQDVRALSASTLECPRCGSVLDRAPPTLTLPPDHDLTTRSATLPLTQTGSLDFTRGDIVAGRYQIVNLLGHGGMGEVYRADDLRVGQPVALKFVTLNANAASGASRRERFVREVRLARQITHPNVCRVYDIGDWHSHLYLSMEYIDGENLKAVLTRVGRLPQDTALDVAQQLCAGLSAAHERQILHLDLKPANVMIDGRGRAIITDFGVARSAEQVTLGTIAGTPAYMAPEQLTGGTLTIQSDLYALGLVLYEMFTGERARAANAAERRDDPKGSARPGAGDGELLPPSHWVPDLDRRVEDVILACLTRDSTKRPSSALAVAAALPGGEPFAAALALSRVPLPQPSTATRRAQRYIRPALLCALLLPMAFLPTTAWPPPPPLPALKLLDVRRFRAMGGDATHRAYCDGLVQGLLFRLTQLNGVRGLQTAPTVDVETAAAAAGTTGARAAGVNLLLDGQCERRGDDVYVGYAINDAHTHQQLRAGRVMQPATASLDLQERLVESVVQQLGLPTDRPATEAARPSSPTAYAAYLVGRGSLLEYGRRENIGKAIESFTQALTIDPRFAAAHAGLGEAYWRQYELTHDATWIDSGRRACAKAIELEPTLAGAHACLGTFDNLTGRYEEAVGEFRGALSAEATNDQADRGLAYALEQLGRVEEAEQTYREAIRLRPDYWAGYSWLATFLHRRGRYAEAVEQFGFALALSPENVRIRRSRGAIYILMGRYEEGIADFEAANALQPTPEGFTNLGVTYFNIRMFTEAIAMLEEAARRGPRDFSLLANLGDAYYFAPGRRAAAAAVYRDALALGARDLVTNPRNAWIEVRIASIYAALGDRPHALESLHRGIPLAADDNESAFFIAVTYARLDDRENAIAWLQKAAAHDYSRTEIRMRVDFDHLRGDARFGALVASK
jgi:tetratricopeptide (TPR) repeat protein